VELTAGRLRRLGEGVGRVVYASPSWVVKRDRSPTEVLALIVIWKALRRLERHLPGDYGRRLRQRPSRQIRALRLLMQAALKVIPPGLWYATHIGKVWRLYHFRKERGEDLARKHLAGTPLVPERVVFPPVRVRIGGWPGWLTVTEATERVEATLHHHLAELARAGLYQAVEEWLVRLLEFRQAGWQRGLFSVDAHLKNFGVSGDRIVLLDAGGLTDRWDEIEARLAYEDVVSQPHIQLGLGSVLSRRPDIAERFNARWKATVSREGIRLHWPGTAGASRAPDGGT
jgi:hypothetical protein